jgi:CDP-paratose 2-epimerase
MDIPRNPNMKPRRILITGGAGFIGSNLSNRLLSRGEEIIIYDNLSRSGCRANIQWLVRNFGRNSFQLVEADITDFTALRSASEKADIIYHLAGQVAVTTSVKDPMKDFMDNALGTVNVLEAACQVGNDPIVLYASTNKVYGCLESVPIIEEETRYQLAGFPLGIPESQALDFHSPYGCSKGAGDQYTIDYARIYKLRTIVMRQSCIYGYRQFGIEDQGWVAWFIIAALKGKPISVYGNGKQVRDILFIEDLLDAYDAAVQNIAVSAGQVYNIGGGPENTISIWKEFSPLLETLLKRNINVRYDDWRPGDQPVYVSDIRKAAQELGWQPKISVRDGIASLANWIEEHQELFQHI